MFAHSISLLTCLAMLWHSVGGCCWHHDHNECDQSDSLSEAVTCSHSSDHCSHHHTEHQHSSDEKHDSQDSSPCNHAQHCEAASCVCVKSSSPDLSKLLPTLGLFDQRTHDELSLHVGLLICNPDRDVLCPREELSSQQHCALRQSWLL